ncbi:hypothetical protein [Streptomyces vilmorinianum]|uniref:hypothetical protein n=1 Tax=Streptomyces vilmorinianum TaxID=3051092 RepID=UPI0010FAD974|nr:hypothetical protein [Streptomyces vilmorinianum]
MTTAASRTTQASPAMQSLLLARLTGAAEHSVTEVRLTPYRRGDARFWCVMALSDGRREVPLPKGAAKRISDALRSAFPSARWGRAQDYDATTGELTEHITALPACLTDGAR